MPAITIKFTLAEILTPHARIEDADVREAIESTPPDLLRRHIKAMKYMEFLRTPYWYYVRGLVIERADRRCQLCGEPGKLHVHHRDYGNHGAEHRFLNDLICLCPTCHDRHHNKMLEIRRKPKPVPIGQEPQRPTKKLKYPSGPFVTVWVTHDMAQGIIPRRPSYHWMKDNGIKPTKSNWRRRIVGRQVPEWIVLNRDPFRPSFKP